jgi:fructose-1,6-bisphosphatase/inositol monophosphatase family enzyme
MDVLRFTLDMRTALYQCGQVARALQGQVAREDKPPDSLHQTSTAVSVVDRLCQEIILLRAHEVAPYLRIYSEELASCPADILALFEGNAGRYVLIIDPLDGSEDYMAGQPHYAHMLGLLDEPSGLMECGLLYFPETLRLCLAVRGLGAFEAQGLGAAMRPMRPGAPPRTVTDIKRLTARDYAALSAHGFSLVPPASASAAYELLRVADGQVGAVAMRHFHGHDTAMAGLLIEMLGGATLNEQGLSVTYRADMPRMPLVVASLDPALAQELAQALGGA